MAVFENFLPWLLRACGQLSEFVGGWSTNVNWRQWADMVETGVDSQWAVDALRSGAPGGRKAVAAVGRKWPPSCQTADDPLGIAFIKDAAARRQIEGLFREALRETNGQMPSDSRDFLSLRSWLWQQASLRVYDLSEL